MTLRDSSDRNQSRKGIRTFSERLRNKLRRKERRLLSESLEQRQLLAGPDLIAIQPNDGQVIQDSQVLTDAPRELVFRFDNQTPIDPATIQGGISITRAGNDGSFETASVTSDLGTNGQVIVEFRSLTPGATGNGIQVQLQSSDRGTGTQQVLVDVDLTDRVITLDLNSNVTSPSSVRDVLTAISDDPEASSLIEAYQVTGSSLNGVGDNIGAGIDLELTGANAAQYVTDLGTNGLVWTRFVANTSGSEGVGTRVEVSRIPLNLAEGQLPYVSVSGKTVQVILDSTPGKESSARDLVAAINSNIDASSLITAQFQSGNLDTVINSTAFSPLVLVGATDTVVVPGYVGLGDTPHEVVFRFNEPLPQDTYQVEVFGEGPLALKNLAGEAFGDGENLGLRFSVNNAPQVAAVVPNPIRRNSDGTLLSESNIVEVYFSEDIANPTNAAFYELIYTRDTASNVDDVSVQPIAVTYDSSNKVARLEFASDLASMTDPSDPAVTLTGAARLRVGGARLSPGVPQVVNPAGEPGDAFVQAYSVDSSALNGGPGASETVVLQGAIENQPGEYDLQFPGGSEVPGVRNIRPEDPARLDLAVPLDVWREGADEVSGITTVYYDFPDTWMGDDPNSGLVSQPDRLKQYLNSITEQQKQRVREALSLYSEYLGVQFVETSGVPVEANAADATYMAIAVGELYGAGFTVFENSEMGGVTVATRPLDAAGSTFLALDPDADAKRDVGNNLLVMDFQDFSDSTDDQLGGEFFRGAMLGVGQLLGYGYADHLSQPVTQATDSVLSPGVDNEATYPSPADIVNGQYLYRPESNDVDLYRFTLDEDGSVSIQTVAERLQSASSLDTHLRLYQNQQGAWVEIAANDDYFSKDSLIELNLTAGEYIVGVSASGNDVYNPVVGGTGIGGRSEGAYDLRIAFKADGQTNLADQHQLQLDGDMDGAEGGDFNYWFLPTNPTTTTYVDSSYTGSRSGTLGTIGNPYASVNDAVDQAGIDYATDSTALQQVRVVGGSYTIGLNNLGIPLDGATLELPKGVQLVVDAGSTFKMSRSRIGVGSTTEGVDRSQASIQILGVPGNPVTFTSAATNPQPGDWGGIDIRSDVDSSDGSRVNFENQGTFYNHIQFADIQYGGGPVSVDGQQVQISPIELASSRPTIINSSIGHSADAAIAATPDSFTETRFDEYRFQRDGLFTPDVSRVGPHIRGNSLVDNTVNGVLFRIQTPSGGELETLRSNARLDDVDVVHVLTENLIIEGSAGGVNGAVQSPEALLIRGTATVGGEVSIGQYTYKVTFFNSDGYETSPSNQTQLITVGAGANAISLTGLPLLSQELANEGFVGRRLYRATVENGVAGDFRQVADLNASDLVYIDTLSAADAALNALVGSSDIRMARLSGGLTVDPGAVIKLQGSRIELTFGAHLYAEGTASDPVVFTSTRDVRFGTGGTFETMASDETEVAQLAGDWGGIYAGFGATLSLDNVTVAGGGGATRIEGGFASFNPIEVHQADLRLANSRLEDNADGRGFVNDPRDLTFERVGRTGNSSGTVFVRGSQPIIVNNDFLDNNGPVVSADLNSFIWQEVVDTGRSTGTLQSVDSNGNSGPLIQGNRIGTTRLNRLDPSVAVGDPINRNYSPFDALAQNSPVDANGDPIFATLLGLEVRGGEVTTGVVLDDVDIVHIVRDTIEIPNQHIYGGLRLESDARGSLVLKFQSQDADNPDTLQRRHAGIVVGGNLITAEDQFVDIADRIGGSLQVVGHPDFPVILTALMDDTVGSGFAPNGQANYDTDNNGSFSDGGDNPLQLSQDLAAAAAGTWGGITIREAASDENVLITNENEPRNLGDLTVNDPNRFKARNEIPSDAQFLGEIANSPSAGDNVRKLGFIVEGAIAQPGDLDVYSFIGEAGTQIWLDIDRTNSNLDTVIELIDANGNIRVLSDNSVTESQGSTDRLTPNFQAEQARSMQTVFEDPTATGLAAFQDLYSTNPRDAGMRLVLPGSAGQRFLYHVRVRSNNAPSASDGSLLDANQIRGGLTEGSYQLQIRLQEGDVFPGTQVRFSDIRFAQNGIEIIGGPTESPLLADEYETKSSNDTLATAQRLGLYETVYDATGVIGIDRNAGNAAGDPNVENVILDNPAGPLSSDRLAKSIAGFLDDVGDVDWYEFEIQYPQLTKDSTARYLSTVFDLDYADGLARPNTSLYVFDAAGNLVLMGTDSNIADDQVIEEGSDPELSRGSFGTADPFIGVSELSEGTYFVAVSNQTRVPSQLDQFFAENPTNPLLRLEPIDSIQRVVEDHIGSSGGGTASDPQVPLLFDDTSIVSYSFDDVMLYVNTGRELWIVNPNTGERYLTNSANGLGLFSGGEVIRDVAFRSNGELFGYTDNFATADDVPEYVLIDTADATLTTLGPMNLTTYEGPPPAPGAAPPVADVGFQVEAMTIRDFFGSGERGYFVGNRPNDPFIDYNTNVLFQFDPETGSVVGGGAPTLGGAGVDPFEVGQIDTTDSNNPFLDSNLGISDATVVGADGVASPQFFDGDQFTVSNASESITFELDQSFTLIADTGITVRDGDAVVIDGLAFEFNTASYLRFTQVAPVGQLAAGTTVVVEGTTGTTTFEFVDSLSTDPVNVEIQILNALGNARPLPRILSDLAAAINANVEGVNAVSSADVVTFNSEPVSLVTNGPGVQLGGGNGVGLPGAVEVPINAAALTDPELVITALANAIRSAGIPVSNAGTQLSLPASGVVTISPDPAIVAGALRLHGSPGVALGNVPIQLLPTDTAATLANRIALAVQAANDSGELPNVSAFGTGQLSHSVEFVGGFVLNASSSFTVGGAANGGLITGIELVNGQLYAVSNAGGLYRVGAGALSGQSQRNVANYVKGSTDLRGINFSGLRAGPMSVEDGTYSQILFGVTAGGDIYAFNTNGELLPVFAGGKSVVSTGIPGAAGLDFSVVDFNMWHVTEQRDTDPGHGINETFNGARPETEGGASLSFNYENLVFASNYPSVAEQPIGARLDGSSTQGIEGSYNVPGGAKGVVQSRNFSLEGYASEDLPMLYFNYFMETENQDGLDALRVYVVTSDGVEHLVSTNNLATGPLETDDEFDDPDPAINGIYDDTIDTDVQPLFDANGAANPQWRQARVSLGDFAGKKDLSLRVEFSTSGTTMTTSNSMRVINGAALDDADNLEFIVEDSATGSTQSFLVNLAPAVIFPSGKQIAEHYASAAPTPVVVTVDGQEYLLNDGSQVAAVDQIEIDLLAGSAVGTTLSQLSASNIAELVAASIQNDLPANPLVSGFNFSDPEDDPAIAVGRNDFLYEATPLPYSGGNLTITGAGRFASDTLPPVNVDDVDLLRVEISEGTTIAVDVTLDFDPSLTAVIRFFDEVGNELTGSLNISTGTIDYTATKTGTHYIGLSGFGNASYDPRIAGSAQSGQVDSYTASVSLTQPADYRASDNAVEFFGGQRQLSASPASLFAVVESSVNAGSTLIEVSRSMSAAEVATAVQEAVAVRFTNGVKERIPTDGPFVRLPGLTLRQSGPFVDEAERYALDQSYVGGVANNAFEGIYLDDFIIGFAERGELATGATVTPANAGFVPNGTLTLTDPPQLVQTTESGSYQLEIRDGSEYVSSGPTSVALPTIQRFAAAPVVIPIQGKPYGVASGSVPLSEIIPASQRPAYQTYDLPTIDVVLDVQTGLPITQIVNGTFAVTLENGALVQLIELDGGFTPVNGQITLIPSESRFRTFDTNDRLSAGYSIEAQAAASMVDGDGFSIFGALNQLDFEFDIRPEPTPGNPNPVFDGPQNPNAVVIEVEASDTASEVVTKIVNVLNSDSVQAALGTTAVRSNATLTGDSTSDFQDDRVLVYGDVRLESNGQPFVSVELTSQRGDSNRDRSQQGTIIIENNRFLFNQTNGVSIVRDAQYGVVSTDARDQFPVALTYPSNLIELNTQGLIPGVVVQNNVVGFNGNAGIYISGISGGGGAITTPIATDMIVNNTIIGGTVVPGVDLGVEVFSGISFPHGGISFADAIDPAGVTLGSDVDFEYTDIFAALSSPDGTGRGPEPASGDFTLSLGSGGRAVFQFTNNLLTGNDSPSPDLVIFETGASESVRVEISRDGKNYFDVGVASGLSPFVDLDAYGFGAGDRFAYVRLTDIVTPFDEPTPSFGPAGADIDAVGAISTVAVDLYTAGSEGIVVTNNAGPTLMNNILANLDLGVNVSSGPVDPNTDAVELSKAQTVLGGNAYYRNTQNANGTAESDLGVFNLLVNDSQPIFVNPVDLIFSPLANVPTIDSSIDSLEDRASLATVRQAVGLPLVPVLAPIVDLNGQIRVDDPLVDSPLGLGNNVFKDRGAEERTDTTGPRITLISPRANDLQQDAGQVVTSATIFDSFDIQLVDGITPADPAAGVGVNDVILNDGSLIRLRRLVSGSQSTETLVEGVDYRYAYDAADNVIRLTPIAGVWQDDAVYTIDVLGDDVGIIKGQSGSSYGDGQLTELDLFDNRLSTQVITKQSIEVDTGISVSVSDLALSRTFAGFTFPNIQGQSLEVFDGYSSEPVFFQLTTTNDPAVNEAIVDSGAIPVRVGEQATAEQIAGALAQAINVSDVRLFAAASGNRLQLRDSVIKSATLFDVPGVTIHGASAYQAVDLSLAAEIRGLNVLGQSFAISDGIDQVEFILVSDSAAAGVGQVPVVIASDAGRSVIASAIQDAIGQTTLQLRSTVINGTLQLRGSSEVATSQSLLAYARPGSMTGDPIDDAFKLSNYSLDAVLTDLAIAANDGATVTIFDGTNEVTFEFDNALLPGVAAGNVAVPIPFNATSRDMVIALKAEIDQSGLDVQVATAARSFRVAGNQAPVSISSATDSVTVSGFGSIGTSPGFGIGIPASGLELDSSIEDGQTFTITRGPISVEFEIDFNQVQDVAGSTLVTVQTPTLDNLANAIAAAINNSALALTAENINAGRITLSGVDTEDISLDMTNTGLSQLGIAGQPNPAALVVPIDADATEIASAFNRVIAQFEPLGVSSEQVGNRVIVSSTEDYVGLTMRGTSVVEDRVSDKVGNQTAAEDLPPLVIYIGGGFDYGDAPEPYASLAAADGPRHFIDEGFALWRQDPSDGTLKGLTYDNDARLPNADEDNGVRVIGSLQPGFSVNLEVGIYNVDGRDFYLDAWFDWDADGVFEESEAYRFGSAGTGRSQLNVGANVISVLVPADAALTEIYARFRLSEQNQIGPTGVAGSGEVEDIRLDVSNNPFRNPVDRYDVNNSGLVTPLDALQIVNALGRNDGNSIFLDVLPLPVDLPEYPDVSGDGVVSALDSLQVINELSRIVNGQSGSGEWVLETADATYVPNSSGVMASTPTALSELLGVSDAPTSQPSSELQSGVVSKTSVFDNAASVQLDSIVDTLAADNASARSQSEADTLDDWFASL